MKIAFKIPPVADNYSYLHLVAEVGQNEISFLVFSKDPVTLCGFYMYTADKPLSSEEYAETITSIISREDVLQKEFGSVNIFYNHKESLLIPALYFSEQDNENYCNLMFGPDAGGLCFQQNVKGSDMKLVYRVHKNIYEALNTIFPKSTSAHGTAEQLFTEKSGNVLKCTVYPTCVKVILLMENKVQIVQYFNYTTPGDVCYHLLNVCERFELQSPAVQLFLSGMIDEKSNLFSELYKYFLYISFLSLPEDVRIAYKLNEQPYQFYSHLTALAQCV